MTDEKLAVDQDESAGEVELSDEEQAMADLKAAITVDREEIGPMRLKLTVTIPEDTLNERRSDQFSELKRDAMIPGFRKGHAPLRLVEKRFGSDVGERLRTQMVGSGYLAAVEKEDIKPLGDPRFWVKVSEERVGEDQKSRKVDSEKLVSLDEAIDLIPVPKEGALTFSCEIETKPDFAIADLEGIRVSKPAITIDDDDIESEVDRIRSLRASYQPVEKGPVKVDDLLYADWKLLVGGEVIEDAANDDLPARDVWVKGIPLTGFGDVVTGKKQGDTVSLEVRVPDDHDNNNLRGATATFSATIHEIKRRHVPPLNDELITSLGFENEDEFRSTLRTALESRLESTIDEGMRKQVGDYLIEHTDLTLPEGLSQRQTERSVARRMIEMYQAGIPQAEIEKRVDELRSMARDQAVRDLKLFFILEKIAEEREIDVREEHLNAAIAEIAQRSNKRFDRVRDELSKGDGLNVLYHSLRDRLVLDDLLTSANITETEGPKKKPAARKAAPSAAAKSRSSTAPSRSVKQQGASPSKRMTAKKATSKASVAKSTAKKTPKKTATKKAKKSGR